MVVRYVSQLEGSALVQFVGEAWCELMRAGYWNRNSVLISGDLNCVYAHQDGEIIGCLTFHVLDGYASVNLAYVLPEFRKCGVYRAMHDRFEKEAKKLGAKHLVNICKYKNYGIQKTCKALGYTPDELHLIKKI